MTRGVWRSGVLVYRWLLMNGNDYWPFAASTVFSAFGLFYVAVPVFVLLVAAWFASWRSGRLVWAIVCGATAAVLGLFAAIPGLATVACLLGERPQVLIDRHLALAANVGACLGVGVGVAAFAGVRAVARALSRRRFRTANSRPTP